MLRARRHAVSGFDIRERKWRALVTDEVRYGCDHPTVAIDLNNLAGLLEATNRHAEIEPLYELRVQILFRFQQRTGHQHPNWKATGKNYGDLMMSALGMTQEQVIARIRNVLGIE